MIPIIRGQQAAQTLKRSIKSASRQYAAVAVPLTDPLEDTLFSKTSRAAPGNVKVTQLENGIKVASIDNGGTLSRISISINHGSRHETPSNLGMTQIMKNAAFISNQQRTSLRTIRELQQTGASVESSATREFLQRSAVFMRNKLPEIMENITPGITQPKFDLWDVDEVKAACLAEYSRLLLDNNAVNLEHLHRIAYRTNLGNQLYCDPLRLKTYNSSDLEEIAQKINVAEQLSVVGYDVSHDELLLYTQDHLGVLPRGKKVETSAQKYFGGEGHHYSQNGLAYATLVSEGAGLFGKNLPAFVVLQQLLGTGTCIKWGGNQVSRLNKAAAAVTDGPLLIKALNISYSDSGLFGFHAVATPEKISPVVKAGVNSISNISKGDVKPEDLERAKTQAKANAMMLTESKEDFLDDLVKQVVFQGGYTPAAESVAGIDKVSAADVTQAAKSMMSSKATLYVSGDVSQAPYLDQLL